eukprot:CAMPEP_0184644790 /NCGR_PEP_ID=MMETSP0308-20130426/1437_1 /TAXON_ID=38269 /ORGANISM="Gloeochaete witrockiana, Strain SAG 46.84" /LENGTH=357 /DNA_ID=CAMNT_0027073497 /DNA_START=246 /DNA_END=1319 /DNA_ORIENTATION=-
MSNEEPQFNDPPTEEVLPLIELGRLIREATLQGDAQKKRDLGTEKAQAQELEETTEAAVKSEAEAGLGPDGPLGEVGDDLHEAQDGINRSSTRLPPRPPPEQLQLPFLAPDEPDYVGLALELDSPKVNERLMAFVKLRGKRLSQNVLPWAIKGLDDDCVPIKVAACNVLGQQYIEGAPEVLENVLQVDPESRVRAEAACSLGKIRWKQSINALRRAYFEDEDWLVRLASVIAIGKLQDEQSMEVIVDALEHERPMEIQKASMNALRALGPQYVLSLFDTLGPYIYSKHSSLRWKLVEILGGHGIAELAHSDEVLSGTLVEVLRLGSEDLDEKVAETAKKSLESIQERFANSSLLADQ